MAPKLYILIRSDLSVAQQGVQMAHVAAVMGKVYPSISWHTTHFVCVSVPDETYLVLWARKVAQHTDCWQIFKETDNTCTAVACLHDGNLFDKLPLWDPVSTLEQRIRDLDEALFEERMGEDL